MGARVEEHDRKKLRRSGSRFVAFRYRLALAWASGHHGDDLVCGSGLFRLPRWPPVFGCNSQAGTLILGERQPVIPNPQVRSKRRAPQIQAGPRITSDQSAAPNRGARQASPIHSSAFCSASSRSNQRACPLASITHLLTPGRQSTVELLCTLTVREPLLLQLSGFSIDKSNLLRARMIITPCNDHVGLHSPSRLVGQH